MCASAPCSEWAIALREAGVLLHEMQELFMSTKPVASILAIHLTAAVTVQAAAIIKPFWKYLSNGVEDCHLRNTEGKVRR